MFIFLGELIASGSSQAMPAPPKAPPPASKSTPPADDVVVIFKAPDPRLLQGAIVKVPPASIGHHGTVPKSAMVQTDLQALRSDVIPVKPPPPPVREFSPQEHRQLEERERRVRAEFQALRSIVLPVKPPPPPIQTLSLIHI